MGMKYALEIYNHNDNINTSDNRMIRTQVAEYLFDHSELPEICRIVGISIKSLQTGYLCHIGTGIKNVV